MESKSKKTAKKSKTPMSDLEGAISVVRDFGVLLVEMQHDFFVNVGVDNSEHVPAIERICDAAYACLKDKGVGTKQAREVLQELLGVARHLFVEEWMRPGEWDDELDDADPQEAIECFDGLLSSTPASASRTLDAGEPGHRPNR